MLKKAILVIMVAIKKEPQGSFAYVTDKLTDDPHVIIHRNQLFLITTSPLTLAAVDYNMFL